jgi:uncharacterized membrane protein YjfL (UPF0719 family)
MKLCARCLALLAVMLPVPVLAQALAPPEPPSLLTLLAHATLFGLLGIALLIGSFYLWELVTPLKLTKVIFEEHNVAAGVVTAGIILGTAVVVAAALLVIS